jgi:hypothetical protein
VIAVMGAIGDQYPSIYSDVDIIARSVGYHREEEIPDVIDDSSRRPHFGRLKELANVIWNHLTRFEAAARFEREGYPPCWDPDAPVKSLRSFTLRVYRKKHTARPPV